MRIHHLQHVPFEGLGSMEPYLRRRGHGLSATHLYRNQRPPKLEDVDWLIVMGGPMSVHDAAEHPWLGLEKRYIRTAIDAGKLVLGVCLGAQLIAHVLGAGVSRSPQREIGWFPITRPHAAVRSWFHEAVPDGLEVFHWHGDTFTLPPGAKRLAASEACANQAFVLEDRVLALQFHLETTPESARALIAHGRSDLDGSSFVQNEQEMLADPGRFARINAVMEAVLARMEDSAGGSR